MLDSGFPPTQLITAPDEFKDALYIDLNAETTPFASLAKKRTFGGCIYYHSTCDKKGASQWGKKNSKSVMLFPINDQARHNRNYSALLAILPRTLPLPRKREPCWLRLRLVRFANRSEVGTGETSRVGIVDDDAAVSEESANARSQSGVLVDEAEETSQLTGQETTRNTYFPAGCVSGRGKTELAISPLRSRRTLDLAVLAGEIADFAGCGGCGVACYFLTALIRVEMSQSAGAASISGDGLVMEVVACDGVSVLVCRAFSCMS